MASQILKVLKSSFINIYVYRKELLKLSKFNKQYREFVKLDTKAKLSTCISDWYPCLNDNTENTSFDAHYVYHPAWAARIIKQINPVKHIDISSTLHFCTILSAFIPTDFYDFRPAKLTLSNLYSGKADLTSLHFNSNSIESLSCMHTIEHIGLGRYGDSLDPDGDFKAIKEIKRVIKPGGSLLFVTPVGRPKVMFNAHRVYDPNAIKSMFDGFTLKSFSLVKDNNDFVEEASLKEGRNQNYGCGCFWFVKIIDDYNKFS
jgi:hypothetical protein